jgi:hypothetical protein
VLLAGLLALNAFAADHRDGSISQDQPADISDTYAFINPNDAGRVIFGITANPYTVPGAAAAFAGDVLYQVKIDNNGDFVEDLVIQVMFSTPGETGQRYFVRGPLAPALTGALNRLANVDPLSGPADGATQTHDGGVRIFSGRTDDPFFIDLIFVRSVLSVPGVPTLEDFDDFDREPGIDLFTGLNVSSFMMELPTELVQGADGGSEINVWSTASRLQYTLRSTGGANRARGFWVQVDRQGLPGINAALVPPARRDEFNRSGTPARDTEAFGDDMANFLANKENLRQLNGFGDTDEDIARFAELVETDILPLLLPDALRLDMNDLSGGLELLPDGSPSFNGRAPRDDFIDLFLFTLTNERIPADRLPANDCTPNIRSLVTREALHPRELTCDADVLDNGFPTVFPFLGAEHHPREAIPPRDGPAAFPPGFPGPGL